MAPKCHASCVANYFFQFCIGLSMIFSDTSGHRLGVKYPNSKKLIFHFLPISRFNLLVMTLVRSTLLKLEIFRLLFMISSTVSLNRM